MVVGDWWLVSPCWFVDVWVDCRVMRLALEGRPVAMPAERYLRIGEHELAAPYHLSCFATVKLCDVCEIDIALLYLLQLARI